jgi:hypothetical protein
LGSILSAGTNGIVVAAGPNDVVTLKGIEIEGARQSPSPGINGVRFLSGAELHMHKFQIRNFNSNGIDIEPTTNSKIFLADGYISDAGNSVSLAGILIRPSGGAGINVSVNRVQLEANSNGIFMDGSGGGGASNLAVRDSLLGGSSSNGIAVASSGPSFKAMVTGTIMNFNAGVGAAVAGSSATLLIGASTITANVTGVSNAGGTLQSFKNNQVAANLSDGTPMTAFPGPGGPLQ